MTGVDEFSCRGSDAAEKSKRGQSLDRPRKPQQRTEVKNRIEDRNRKRGNEALRERETQGWRERNGEGEREGGVFT